MNRIVNIHEAKTHFSKLLAAIERGEEVIIARAGVHVAKLVPYSATRPRFAEFTPGLHGVHSDALLEPSTEDELATWTTSLEPQ